MHKNEVVRNFSTSFLFFLTFFSLQLRINAVILHTNSIVRKNKIITRTYFINYNISLMKKFVLILLSITISVLASAQVTAYSIGNERYGGRSETSMDTTLFNFHAATPQQEYSNFVNYLGTVGSPLQSSIYFERRARTPFMFSDAYDAYLWKAGDVKFLLNTPFYVDATVRGTNPIGGSQLSEGSVRVNLGGSINSHVALGASGQFAASNGLNGTDYNQVGNGYAWMALTYDRYTGNFAATTNNIANRENTLVNDLSTGVGYVQNVYIMNNVFHLGNDDAKDAINLIYSTKWEDVSRSYRTSAAVDSIAFASFRHSLALQIDKNKLEVMPFSLKYFFDYEYRYHGCYSQDTLTRDLIHDHHLHTGFTIFDTYKMKNGSFNYSLDADMFIYGILTTEGGVFADFSRDFEVASEPMDVSWGLGLVRDSNTKLLTKFDSYYTNWENFDFLQYHRTEANVRFSLPKRGLSFGIKTDNIDRLIYFDETGSPAQLDTYTRVVAADVKANLNFGKFHLDNQLVYQYSSNKEALPLPDFSIYSNFYFMDSYGDWTIQPGASINYYTAYYAQSYDVVSGSFYNQTSTLVGNTPDMSLYLNAQYKNIRLFANWNYANSQVFGGELYTAPEYKKTSRLEVGFAWNL